MKGLIQIRQTPKVSVAVVFAVTVFLAVPADRAFAICPAAEIEVAPSSALPGSQVTVRGLGFLATCYDVQICPGELCAPRRDLPLRDIDLVLAQGANKWTLATVDANDDFRFSEVVTLPEHIDAGAGVITASGTEARAAFSVRRGRSGVPVAAAGLLAVTVAVGALRLMRKRKRDQIAV